MTTADRGEAQPVASIDVGREAERVAGFGSWELVPATGELRWSDNLFRLYGLDPHGDTPSLDLSLERTHPEDRVRHQREMERIVEGALAQSSDYRIVLPDRTVRHVRYKVARVEEQPRRLIGCLLDLTDQRLAEDTVAAHVATSEALAAWDSLESGGERLLRRLSEALGCVAGSIWLPEQDSLVSRVCWHRDTDLMFEFEAATRQLSLVRGAGLPGRVWESRAPISVPRVTDDPRFLRRDSAARAGIVGALMLPALSRDEVLAVVSLYAPHAIAPNERLSRSLAAIGREVGAFLAQRRGQLRALRLTPRELEVLQFAADGCPGPEIAQRLTISPATVKSHFEHIYSKLGVSDRAAAVATAMRDGLVE